jgi:hypothetical protein
MIPDLSVAENVRRWRALEGAKHRMFYTLLQLQLALETKAENAAVLVFRFLADASHGAP